MVSFSEISYTLVAGYAVYNKKKSIIAQTEVMYINGTTKICYKTANYPGNVYYLSGSSFLNSNTIVACGGYLGKGLRTSDCYSMSNDLKWTHFANLKGPKFGTASVIVKNGLWVLALLVTGIGDKFSLDLCSIVCMYNIQFTHIAVFGHTGIQLYIHAAERM